MYVYVHLNSNWIIYSYGGLFRLGNDFLNLSQVESSRIISCWGLLRTQQFYLTQPHMYALASTRVRINKICSKHITTRHFQGQCQIFT